MAAARKLEQTPSLIDADVADDVRSTHAAISVAGRARPARRKAGRQVADMLVRLNTVGSSRPMVPDTPLPN